MRNNLPVTHAEYSITDETLIVSKTDLKGKQTYFNDQFVEASGFTEQELMGQPHNIIRPPRHAAGPPYGIEMPTKERSCPWWTVRQMLLTGLEVLTSDQRGAPRVPNLRRTTGRRLPQCCTIRCDESCVR